MSYESFDFFKYVSDLNSFPLIKYSDACKWQRRLDTYSSRSFIITVNKLWFLCIAFIMTLTKWHSGIGQCTARQKKNYSFHCTQHQHFATLYRIYNVQSSVSDKRRINNYNYSSENYCNGWQTTGGLWARTYDTTCNYRIINMHEADFCFVLFWFGVAESSRKRKISINFNDVDRKNAHSSSLFKKANKTKMQRWIGFPVKNWNRKWLNSENNG